MYTQIKFHQKWLQLVILTTFNGSLILSSTPAFAEPIPLTQATLRKVVNRVDLLLRSQLVRSAQVNDRLSNSGDAVKTQRASRTELKFNDGTLAKVGELATFRFTPNTRRFELGNGTYLFLVPPGRGNTEFNTPNAKAGVKGSALFIRYIEESDTTIMGALTNNPLGPMDITVGGKKQDLYAGQMVVAIKDRIDRVETFDLTTFLRTSPMYRDIDLMDPDLQAVRQEMTDAVTTQVAAIGTLFTKVATTPKPGIAPDPTASVPRRESTEARESFNNPGRNQPIVKPEPPNIKDPIVKPDSPNVKDPIVKPDSPNIKDPIVKPEPPNIKDPIVKPEPPNIKDPIVKPEPPNIKDPGQHQYTYVTVYVDGKPVVYLKVDGKIDYSQVIQFIKPSIGPQPLPIETPSQSTPPSQPTSPSQPAPVESISVGPIRVVPVESSKPRVEKIPVIEIKPDIKDPIKVIQSAIDPIKPPLDLIKAPVEIVKPTIDPIKPPLDLIKAPVEIVRPTIDPIKLPVDLKPTTIDPTKQPVDLNKFPPEIIKPIIAPIKPPVDLIETPIEIVKPTIDPSKLPVELGKPAIEITPPVIVPDVIKVAPAALTEPPIVTTPPVTPPTITPPVTPPIAPLVTIPPITPPVTTPPVTTPPITPLVTIPPVTTPPIAPLVITSPVTAP